MPKIVTVARHMIYDDRGNIIYDDKNGVGQSYFFNDKNQLIFSISSLDSSCIKFEYDAKGNLVHEIHDPDRLEVWYHYDKNHNMIYQNDSYGNEEIKRYNRKVN